MSEHLSATGPQSQPVCTTGKFTFYTADGLRRKSPMTWLVEDTLPNTGLASVYGSSGVGKSFLCLDLAAAIASGDDWFGHPTRQGSVVYLGLEGEHGFQGRVMAWSEQNGTPFPGKVKFSFDSFQFKGNDDAEELAHSIRTCGDADLIIIDTLSRTMPGMDENSSTDMSRIIAGATLLQRATKGLVLLVHHSGKESGRGLRGHSSLHAALDTIIEVERDGERHRWRLAKSKDSEDGVSHSFALAKVEITLPDADKPLTSCVIQAMGGGGNFRQPSIPRGSNQQRILDEVRNLLTPLRVTAVMQNHESSDVTLPVDEVMEKLKRSLVNVDTKHRAERARESLDALVRQGYLSLIDDRVGYLLWKRDGKAKTLEK